VAHDLSPSLQARLQDVGAILDQVEKQLRRLSHELRPTILDDLGLVPALQFLADGISKRTKLTIRVESSLEGRHAAAVSWFEKALAEQRDSLLRGEPPNAAEAKKRLDRRGR